MRDAEELLSPFPLALPRPLSSPCRPSRSSSFGADRRGVVRLDSTRLDSEWLAVVDLSPRFSSVPVNKARGSCFAFGWPRWRGSVLLFRNYPPSFFASPRSRFPPFILASADPPSEDAILRHAPAKIMQEKPLWLSERGRISSASETLLGRLPRARTRLLEQSNWFCAFLLFDNGRRGSAARFYT